MKSLPCAIFSAILIVLTLLSCKKKPKGPDPGPGPVICNTPFSTLVKNDTILNITADTAYSTQNNTFYSEHIIAAGNGCSVEFEGNNFPAAGTFIITPVFNEVVAGSQKVYIQYYEAGKTFIAQSGNLTVSGSGAAGIIEFCKLNFRESFGEEKTISLKTDSE